MSGPWNSVLSQPGTCGSLDLNKEMVLWDQGGNRCRFLEGLDLYSWASGRLLLPPSLFFPLIKEEPVLPV